MTRIDERDIRTHELIEWLDDVANQLRWQRRNGRWVSNICNKMRDLERQIEDTASDFSRDD